MISIVVPVYNTAKYLDQAIKSVLDQTFGEWELILVDDGSTDESAQICMRYAGQDPRIRYIHKSNGGQASARNLGIKNARFDWIAFLDSDDWWVPEKLEIQVKELQETGADFLYSAGFEFEDGKTREYTWHFDKFTGREFFDILYKSCAVNCNTVILRKSVLLNAGGFNEAQILRGVEDWDLWLKVSRMVEWVYGSKKKLAYYRIHGGGIHHQMARMFIGKWHVYKSYISDKSIRRLVKLRQYRYVFRELMNHLYDEKRYDEIKTFMREFRKSDKFNPATLKQSLFIHILSPRAFNWLSRKVIYRVAYRLEYLTYLLFIPQKLRNS